MYAERFTEHDLRKKLASLVKELDTLPSKIEYAVRSRDSAYEKIDEYREKAVKHARRLDQVRRQKQLLELSVKLIEDQLRVIKHYRGEEA